MVWYETLLSGVFGAIIGSLVFYIISRQQITISKQQIKGMDKNHKLIKDIIKIQDKKIIELKKEIGLLKTDFEKKSLLDYELEKERLEMEKQNREWEKNQKEQQQKWKESQKRLENLFKYSEKIKKYLNED